MAVKLNAKPGVIGFLSLWFLVPPALGTTSLEYRWETQRSSENIWVSQLAGIHQSFGSNMGSVRVQDEARYGETAQSLRLGWTWAIRGSDYTVHWTQGWGGAWLPHEAITLRGRTPLRKTWISHYQATYARYPTEQLTVVAIGLSHYWGNFRGLGQITGYHVLEARPTVTPTWYAGFRGTLSYYFPDCSLNLTVQQSLAPGTAPVFSPEETESAGFWAAYSWSTHWTIVPDLSFYHQQGTPTYLGGGLLLQYRF